MKNKRLKGVKSGITRRLLTYVKPYRGYVAGAFVFSILYVACVLIGPVLYGWAIDAMIGKGAVDFAEVAKMTTGFIVSVVFSSLSQKFLNNCVNSLCY